MIISLVQSQDFSDLLRQIQQTRTQVFAQANTALFDLYWHIGQTIEKRVQSAGWGKCVVAELAGVIGHNYPNIGVLRLGDKDDEVVGYALSRNLSRALIAVYHLQLPDDKLLQTRTYGLGVAAGAYDEQ